MVLPRLLAFSPTQLAADFKPSPREADILRKFFGIGTPEKTLEEIGDELHLTRERVRQIKEKAIHKLESGQRSRILKTYLG